MKKQKIDKVYSTGDNLVHLTGIDPRGGSATACGDVDIIENEYLPTNQPLTCQSCIDIYNFLRYGITTYCREFKK